jgi:hypothetical protein
MPSEASERYILVLNGPSELGYRLRGYSKASQTLSNASDFSRSPVDRKPSL